MIITQASGSHYTAGGKYCRRCKYFIMTQQMVCQCCGMQLRTTPAERECKEKVHRKRKMSWALQNRR